MNISIPYGLSSLTVHIPDKFKVDMIQPVEVPATDNPMDLVQSALENLLGDAAWSEIAGAKSVAIAINDKTRPVPHQYLLPPLMELLTALGISDECITFYVAGGIHPPMAPDEYPEILPEDLLQRYRVISHNAEDKDHLTYIGKTSHGTPIWSNQSYVQSDIKIVIGNIEPHQFVGYSGGVKSAAIGLSGVETINRNHALMTHPASQLGEYETNPARQDVEEIGQSMGIHIALNAILNQDKEIVHVLAGDPVAVMQTGVPISRQICQVAVGHQYKLIISSPGGHPKDINVYQAQKALAHAARITRPGGVIILAAACPEGTGSPHYENWALGKSSYAEVLEQFRSEGFHIGPHKAYQIARDACNIRLLFCSEMDEDLARALLLNPVRDIQNAIDVALKDVQSGEHVGVMPHASSVIPYLMRAGAKKT